MKRLSLQNLVWPLLALFGAGAFWLALGFRFGTAANIGAAIYPLFLSGVIVAVSLYALLRGRGTAFETPDRRAFVAITASVVLFILLAERLGLVPTVVVSMLVAYAGQTQRRYLFVLVYATLFAIGTWAVFSFGLGLPLPSVRLP